MNRFASISNINRKYRNSQLGASGNIVGGYSANYVPPAIGIHETGIIGSQTVGRQLGLRNSHVISSTHTPGLHSGAQVIRVEQPPQVIYHQPQSGPILSNTLNVKNGVINQSNGAPIVNQSTYRDRNSYTETRTQGAKSSPWWCWLLCGILGLLLLAGLAFGLWTYLCNTQSQDRSGKELNLNQENHRKQNIPIASNHPILQKQNKNTHRQSQKENNLISNKETPIIKPLPQQNKVQNNVLNKQPRQEVKSETRIVCEKGFFLHNGKCISCPEGAVWNGTNCIRKRPVTQIISTDEDKTVSGAVDTQSQSDKGESEKQNNKKSHLSQSQYGVGQGLKDIAVTTGGFAKRFWEGTKEAASNAWQGGKKMRQEAANSDSPAVSGFAQGLGKVSDTTKTIATNAWTEAKGLFSRLTRPIEPQKVQTPPQAKVVHMKKLHY